MQEFYQLRKDNEQEKASIMFTILPAGRDTEFMVQLRKFKKNEETQKTEWRFYSEYSARHNTAKLIESLEADGFRI